MGDFELISAWLYGEKDFTAGVEIYKRLGKNYVLKAQFALGETRQRKDRLTEELKEILSSLKPELTKKQAIQTAVITVREQQAFSASDLPTAPQEIQLAIKKRKALYLEYHTRFADLKPYVPQDIRRATALRILDIFDEIKPLWDLTKYYDKYLKLPPKPAMIIKLDLADQSDLELNQAFENAYKYIRKNLSKSLKREQVLTRYHQAKQIETELLKRDAFLHFRYQLPELTEQ